MKDVALRGLVALAGLVPVLFASQPSAADAGLLRVSEISPPYRISVFSEPTPLHVDRGALSILVADAETGQPLRDVGVQVHVTPLAEPGHSFDTVAQRRERGLRFFTTLTPPDALHVCPMHPEVVSERPGSCPHCGMALVSRTGPPGAWQIRVYVQGDRGEGSVSFEADIQPPESPWISMGPSLAVPPLGILLFVLHQSLRNRMHGRRGERRQN